MHHKVPVKFDRANITHKIFLAYSLCIHIDVVPIIGNNYIRLMRSDHVESVLAAQLLSIHENHPLSIRVNDPRIFKDFIESRPYESMLGRPLKINKFYKTLQHISASNAIRGLDACIRLIAEENNQRFYIMVINYFNHGAKLDDNCKNYFMNLSYLDAAEFLRIAHNNSCDIGSGI